MDQLQFDDRVSLSCLVGILKRNAESNKKIVFISTDPENDSISYKTLYHESLKYGDVLSSFKIRPGHEVIIQIKNPKHFILVFWACLCKGILPVPLSVAENEDGKKKLLNVLKKLSNPVIIYDCFDLHAFTEGITSNKLSNDLSVVPRFACEEIFNVSGPSDVLTESVSYTNAFIQFSSGSSGSPKGVLLSHKNLITNIADIFRRSSMAASSKLLNWMPLTHDMGLIGFHLTGVFGNLDQFVIPTEIFIKRPIIWLDNIDKYKITHTYSPNFGYRYLLSSISNQRVYSWDLSSLQIVFNGAETISGSLCDEFESFFAKFQLERNVIFPAYGLAEASVALTLHEGGARKEYAIERHSMEIGNKIQFISGDGMRVMSTGSSMDSCSVRIVDNQNNMLPSGYFGNIQAKGANITAGYYNQEDETKNLFTPDGWLHTGDLGFMQGDQLVVTGRKKTLIIINGQNYFPSDIEQFLLEIPEVVMGKVAASSTMLHGEEKLIIFLSLKIPQKLRGSLVHRIREKILQRMDLVVYDVVFIKKIPKTTSGKTQYYRLREEYEESNENNFNSTNYLIPNTQTLLQIVRKYFGASLAENDNFFSFGLNSLAALQITFEVNKACNTELVITDLFDYPTVNLLQSRLENVSAKKPAITRLQPSEYYETSLAQKRLWILNKLSNSENFNIGLSFLIQGVDDSAQLVNAWKKIVDRHEIFRTSFVEINGILKQRIFSPIESHIAIGEKDFSAHPNPAGSVKKFGRQLFVEPVTLHENSLLKITIIKTAPGTYYSIIFCHHIIIDGWSVAVLKSEVLKNLMNNTYPDLQFQYKDFAHWYSREVESELYTHDKLFWKQKYCDGFPSFTFPILKRKDPLNNLSRGAVIKRKISLDNITRLTSITKEADTTLFVGLSCAITILLSRYTRNGIVFFGTPTTGRVSSELENQVGYYLNILPISFSVSEEKCFRGILRNFKEEYNELYRHQNYPIEKIIELDQTGSRSVYSLFEILILFENFDSLHSSPDHSNMASSDKNINIQVEEIENTSLASNLYFEFVMKGGDVCLRLKYNTSLYFHEQIEELVQNFELLLHRCTSFPQLAISSFGKVSDKEEEILLGQFNPPVVRPVSTTLLDLFHNQVKLFPTKSAVVCDERILSYEHLNNESDRLARIFLYRKIEKGNVVVLYLDRTEWMVISILAAWKLGVTVIPVDSLMPVNRVLQIVSDSSAVAIVSDKNLEVDFTIDKISLDSIAEQTRSQDLIVRSTCDDIAYVIYTSGSTGRSKAVAVKHSALMSVTSAWVNCYNLQELNPRILQISSFGFDVFIGDLCRTLSVGGCMIICPTEVRGIPEEMFKILTFHKVNIFESTPSIVIPLLRFILRNNLPYDFLKIIIVGSEKWLLSEYSKLRSQLPETIRLINSYGTTETTVDSTLFESMNLTDLPSTYVPIGKPLTNTTCYILDDYRRLVPVGVPGNLYLGGSGVSEGYLNDPGLTNISFINNPYGSGKMYSTGDLARWLPGGNIEFLERTDDQIKILGHRVEPKELEQVISEFNGIQKAFVTLKSVELEDFICAYLIADKDIDITKLRSFLLARVPRFMVPTHFILIPQFPLTLNGKVDVKSLPLPKKVSQAEELAEPNLTEKAVIDIWEEILSKKGIGILDDFFELGGQSIKAVQILFKVNQRFGTSLNLSQFFSFPKLSDFCELIESSSTHPQLQSDSTIKVFDLSSNQKGIYLHTKFSNCPALYNLPVAFEIQGDFDLIAFEDAINDLVQRHEILRTIFYASGAELFQKVLDDTPRFNISTCDLLDEQDLEPLVESLRKTEFDFSVWPIFKVALIKPVKERALLIFVINHIISDAISYDIIFKELAILYKRPSSTARPKYQYRDFVFQQRESQTRKPLDHSYLSKIANGLSPLNLAGNSTADKIRSYHASHHVFNITGELARDFQQVCKHRNISPFIFWATSLTALVHLYTKQGKIPIAYPCTERDILSEETMIGFFSNTQLLALQVEKCDSFENIFLKIKESLFENLSWRSFSFDQVTEKLANLTSVVAPVEVTLVLNETDSSEVLSLGTTKVTPLRIPVPYAKTDITFFVNRIESRWEVDIEYKSDLFTFMQVERFGNQLIDIAKTIINDSKTSLEKLRLFGKNDKLIYEKFNDTQTPEFSGHSIAGLFSKRMVEHSEKPALIIKDEVVTYAELEQKADRLANYFYYDLKIHKGDVVGLYVREIAQLPIVILAILKTGAAFLPVDYSTPVDRLKFIINDSQSRFLISDTHLKDFLPSTVYLLADVLNSIRDVESVNQLPSIDPNSVLYILYTSGSTGKPKGVKIRNKSMCNYALWFNRNLLNDNNGFHTCLFTSIGFDLTFSSIFPPLLRGDSIVIFPDENPIKILQKIFSGNYGINTIKITPSHIALISATCQVNPFLKKIIIGGETLTEQNIKILQEKAPLSDIYNEYGPTETTIGSSIMRVTTPEESKLIGRPIANTRIYIVSDEQYLLPAGMEGEIAIAGIGLAEGYVGNENLTKGKFVFSDDINESTDLTGDIAKLNYTGVLEFNGRKDDQVKIHGFRIEPKEIEKVLLSEDYISNALVLPRRSNDDLLLVAYLQFKRKVAVERVRETLGSKLPSYMMPSFFIEMTSFPLNTNGKINIPALPFGDEYFMNDKASPIGELTPLESNLLKLWKDVLKNPSLDVHSNFFAYGGDSFKAIQLLNLIQVSYPGLIDIPDIYNYPTVRAMARYTEKKVGHETKNDSTFDEFIV